MSYILHEYSQIHDPHDRILTATNLNDAKKEAEKIALYAVSSLQIRDQKTNNVICEKPFYYYTKHRRSKKWISVKPASGG